MNADTQAKGDLRYVDTARKAISVPQEYIAGEAFLPRWQCRLEDAVAKCLAEVDVPITSVIPSHVAIPSYPGHGRESQGKA